jgi:hypothetical protein
VVPNFSTAQSGRCGVNRELTTVAWELIKMSTFPWGYYKRCLDVPAEID